jgi:TRAP-type mannitol/chloroaromatic compound transport system substrate-binding protein
VQSRQFNEVQQRVQRVDVEKLSADYQMRLAEIVKALSAKMSEQAQAALKDSEQRMGKERLQSNYAIFRDFPPTVLPADFVADQTRMQDGRRDSARRVLQKALDAQRKGKPIDKKSLEVIVNLEFFLPAEAAAAKRMIGRQ